MGEVSGLISRAKAVLAATEEAEVLRSIASYSDAFEQWGERNLGLGRALNAEEKPELQQLQALHAQVVARAEELKGQLSQHLRDLKKKGKGILVYTDILPKRLSSIRPRKF
jgi:hypothetical protein